MIGLPLQFVQLALRPPLHAVNLIRSIWLSGMCLLMTSQGPKLQAQSGHNTSVAALACPQQQTSPWVKVYEAGPLI